MRCCLQNTTAVLHLLAQGNFSAASGLFAGAYAEVAANSWLLGSVSEDRSSAKQGGETEGHILNGALQGGTELARLALNLPVAFLQTLSTASSMLSQVVVFLTALFYLLAAKDSCLDVLGEILMVIDQKKVIFGISELVVRAVLISALKMSAFHALLTWLLYSWGQVPVVVVPTVLSALVALVPVVSPVWSVSVWAAVYLWAQNEKASAAGALVVNFAVWWQVPAVIYAEIPESNPWLTGLSVVLGIGHFGAAGVVLGPMLASVPLVCFNLMRLFNEDHAQDHSPKTPTYQRRKSVFTIYRHQGEDPDAEPKESSGSVASRGEAKEARSAQLPTLPRTPPRTAEVEVREDFAEEEVQRDSDSAEGTEPSCEAESMCSGPADLQPASTDQVQLRKRRGKVSS
ncbi:unnamed protein product [Polarella glacialis]|uniref:Uncharacterized protein n=1 Tax=Polarella glacialis TaxID=89957 RepID=A0A813HBM4_POLGL|nr:unnamed protein product [Polarella glacialis]